MCYSLIFQNRNKSYIIEAINSAGLIILVTGAGGAFGAVINESGIGDHLITTMQNWSIPVLLLAFIFSQILRASLGASTVALVTTSSIMGPLAFDLGVAPILLGLAICAGAIGLSLPNDSGFWVVNKFGKLTIPQTLKAWTNAFVESIENYEGLNVKSEPMNVNGFEVNKIIRATEG